MCSDSMERSQFSDLTKEDVAMAKVKFNVNTEYMYLQNFKVLQSTINAQSALF